MAGSDLVEYDVGNPSAHPRKVYADGAWHTIGPKQTKRLPMTETQRQNAYGEGVSISRAAAPTQPAPADDKSANRDARVAPKGGRPPVVDE